jgi:hypothetical protein
VTNSFGVDQFQTKEGRRGKEVKQEDELPEIIKSRIEMEDRVESWK